MTGILGDWMTPDRALAFQAIGQGLGQLANGQTPNLGPALMKMQERQTNASFRNQMAQMGLMDSFSAEQRAALSMMPANLAQDIIYKHLFAPKTRADYSHMKEINGVLYDMEKMQPVYFAPDSDKSPTSIQEFNYAVQNGYQGTYEDWKTLGRSQNTFNIGGEAKYGTIPSGYMLQETAEGVSMVPVPGGPAAAKAEAEALAAANKAKSDIDQAEFLTGEIDRALATIKENPWSTTGALGAVNSFLPGTARGDLESSLTTIKGNLGFEELKKMRDSSPTGGAVGQLSDRELMVLSSMAGSLELNQSQDQLIFNLQRIQKTFKEMLEAKGVAQPTINSGAELPPISSMTDAQIREMTSEQVRKLRGQDLMDYIDRLGAR